MPLKVVSNELARGVLAPHRPSNEGTRVSPIEHEPDPQAAAEAAIVGRRTTTSVGGS